MIRTKLVLCAKRIVHDRLEDGVTAVDILEDQDAQGFPVMFPRLYLLWIVKRELDDPTICDGNVTIMLDEEQLAQFPLHLDFQGLLRNRQIVAVGGLVVSRPGKVKVVFRAANIEEATYDFQVSPAAPQIQNVAAPAVLPAQA